MRLGETPVPIPNTMVKTQEADGTILATVWESRWLPGFDYYMRKHLIYSTFQIYLSGQNICSKPGLVAQQVRASA